MREFKVGDYQEKLNEFYNIQRKDFPFLKQNIEMLERSALREIESNGIHFRTQWNPVRTLSVTAKTDKESIARRKCFLCRENRPEKQGRLVYSNRYDILCNPYPIFQKHFTIPSIEHKPQQFVSVLDDFLMISRDLHELVLFYNAPACGASAPDHLHFQAGNKGLLPVEEDTEKLKKKFGIFSRVSGKLEITAVDDEFRRLLILESNDIFKMARGIKLILLKIPWKRKEEPMINVLSYYQGFWRVFIFFREKHRPRQYFEGGKDHLLLSPGAVDMGGTLITPLREDYEKISKEDIMDIFRQVSLDRKKFLLLPDLLKSFDL